MPLPTLQVLQAMKRAEIQKLCKDYGVKANLKTEALIQLLLDIDNNAPQLHTQRARSVSTRHSSRSTGGRLSSVIIHDIDEGHASEEEEEKESHSEEPENQPNPDIVPPATRTRKAKDTQKRLGVGRPAAAGGSGVRVSTGRSKRGKAPRAALPVQDTIMEEPEGSGNEEEEDNKEVIPDTEATTVEVIPETNGPSMPDIDQIIANAIQPLQDQLQQFKAELAKMKDTQAELADLRAKTTQIPQLQDLVSSLKLQVEGLSKSSATPSLQASSGKPRLYDAARASTPRRPQPRAAEPEAGPSSLRPPITIAHPGIAPQLLGKRHRDSVASNVSGVIEEGEEEDFSPDDLARQVVRHGKKRARLADEDEDGEDAGPSPNENEHMPGFEVYRGPESNADYLGSPPPRNHLPTFYGSPQSPPPRQTSTPLRQDGVLPPFGITDIPVPATPPPGFMANIAFPEPPASPTPARASINELPAIRRGASDMFAALGLPGMARAQEAMAFPPLTPPGDRFINPAALSQPSSGAGGSTTGFHLGDDEEDGMATPSTPTKRTMYGTELSNNSRFGDFGVGFWAHGR